MCRPIEVKAYGLSLLWPLGCWRAAFQHQTCLIFQDLRSQKVYLTKLSVPRLDFHQPFRHKRPVIFASQKPPARNRDPLPNGPGNRKPGTRKRQSMQLFTI